MEKFPKRVPQDMQKLFLLIQKKMILLISAFILSCSGKPISKEYEYLGGFFSAGFMTGTLLAPSYEKPEMHGLYWGSIAGLSSLLIYDILNIKNPKDKYYETLLHSKHLSEGIVKKDAEVLGKLVKKGSRYKLIEINEFDYVDSKTLNHLTKQLIIIPGKSD